MNGHRLGTLLTSVLVFAASTAVASPGVQDTRAPITPANLRTSQLDVDRYESRITVSRVRTKGKRIASFVAEPRLIDEGAVIIFEAVSKAKSGDVPRWSCIAVRDVAECLGTPLRLRYLPKDERIVLTARVVPRTKAVVLASR